MHRYRNIAAATSVALLGYSAPGAAALGGDAASVEGDRVALRAIRSMRALPACDVLELALASGTTVRQYVSKGTVFAVSWRGAYKPDLKQLLGPHFDTLAAHVARMPLAGHTQVHLDTTTLVVHAGGHMRALGGIAYLPGALPPGFDIEQLQ